MKTTKVKSKSNRTMKSTSRSGNSHFRPPLTTNRRNVPYIPIHLPIRIYLPTYGLYRTTACHNGRRFPRRRMGRLTNYYYYIHIMFYYKNIQIVQREYMPAYEHVSQSIIINFSLPARYELDPFVCGTCLEERRHFSVPRRKTHGPTQRYVSSFKFYAHDYVSSTGR